MAAPTKLLGSFGLAAKTVSKCGTLPSRLTRILGSTRIGLVLVLENAALCGPVGRSSAGICPTKITKVASVSIPKKGVFDGTRRDNKDVCMRFPYNSMDWQRKCIWKMAGLPFVHGSDYCISTKVTE